jgi:hypothetical protein
MSSTNLRVHIYGHESAFLSEIAAHFNGEIADTAQVESDLAIFAINPNTGISPETIAIWESLDDYLLPRLIVVTGLTGNDGDFDDAVMLANRVFEKCVTPFLVLHDEDGSPCALISLNDLQITNYQSGATEVLESADEHKTLVSEFRDEYLLAIDQMGPAAFSAGLLFPAIPVDFNTGLGVNEVKSYLDQL